jgi:hypothetical protein
MAPRNPQQDSSISYVGAKEIALIFLVVIVLAGTAASLALFA